MSRKKKLGRRIYWICLGVYTLILASAAVFCLTKVWGYAEEYEQAQPSKTMDAYVASLSQNLWDDNIEATIAAMPHEVQTDEECAQIVQDMLQNGISYKRASGSGSEMTAVYNLLCDGSQFGQVTLKQDESKAQELEYGLLPWIVYKEEFDFTGLYSSMQITVPATYSVELNGVELGSEYIIEDGIRYDVLEDYYGDYPNLPTKVTYKFDNIIGHLEPLVYGEDGEQVEIDESRDDSQYIKPVAEETSTRLQEFASAFVERYKSYIAGMYEPSYGYQRLLPYVTLGSDLDDRLKLAQDGISWSYKHGNTVKINFVTLDSAIDVGDGVYIISISSEAVLTDGEIQSDTMRLIVTDSGNDIRAVSLELL